MTLKKLAEDYGLTPEGVRYALEQYQTVICEITNNKLSKLCYPAQTILNCAKEYIERDEVQLTVEPKAIDLSDETKAWLDGMDAAEALKNIADICVDWDGYRTADGLGGLVNEIWAYARYCEYIQQPRVMTLEEVKASKGTDMFLEISGYSGDVPYITAATLDGVGTSGVSFYHSSFDFATYNNPSFGWRCWTARPTDEQRRETPWND